MACIRALLFWLHFTAFALFPAFAQHAEIPQNVSISAITYGGTGCPQGSASVLISGKMSARSPSMFQVWVLNITKPTGRASL